MSGDFALEMGKAFELMQQYLNTLTTVNAPHLLAHMQ